MDFGPSFSVVEVSSSESVYPDALLLPTFVAGVDEEEALAVLTAADGWVAEDEELFLGFFPFRGCFPLSGEFLLLVGLVFAMILICLFTKQQKMDDLGGCCVWLKWRS